MWDWVAREGAVVLLIVRPRGGKKKNVAGFPGVCCAALRGAASPSLASCSLHRAAARLFACHGAGSGIHAGRAASHCVLSLATIVRPDGRRGADEVDEVDKAEVRNAEWGKRLRSYEVTK